MRFSLLILCSMLFAQAVFAQGNPRIKLTQLEQSKTVEGSKAGQIPLTNSAGDLRYGQYVEIDLVQLATVPTSTGNTSNYSEFVIGSDSNIYYIDWQGRGLRLNLSGGTDRNGYYGGNGGNGGDNTIPSVTKSTLTNQLTFYRATDDAGGFVPVRIQVDAGNEPEFLSMKNVSDSLLFSRSDQEFVIHSTNGFNLQSDILLGLLGDSIQVSGALAANPSDHTFLLLRAGSDRLIKKTGIDSTDLNFDALQNLSASGAGPTSYNVDLSGGGGFVTFTEGTNVDLTRSGNNITISATGGGGGGQSLSVAGNTTTLSGGGGSMTIAGAGINVATTLGSTITITGTEVDGSISNEGSLTVGAGTGTTSIINSNTSGSTGVTLTAGTGLSISEAGNVITLTNSNPDQVVSITGAGISVVTGTYPNFTVTSTEVDGSVSNEGSLTVGAGTGTTSIINSNTSGSTGVTLTAGTGLSISESGNVITLSSTAGADQTFANTSTSSTHTLTLSASGGSLTLVEQPGLSIATTGTTLDGIVTFSPADISPTNELQTFANTSSSTTHTITLSNTGGSVQLAEGTGIGLATTGTALDGIVTVTNSSPDQVVSITGAGISVVTGTYPNFTVTSTEVDGSISNEGSLTVGAGTGTTSIINSNTSGSTGVTLTASTGLSISETGNVITLTNSSPDQVVSITGAGISVVTGTYPNFTVTSTEVDGSVSNEGSLTVGAGTGTTSIINSNTSGSTGVTLTAGTGLSISESGNVITLSSSVTDTKNGYYGGNSGNGGDATIPSVTKSTLTNQLTLYKATDDLGGFVPLRVQVDAGNESDFQSFVQNGDSLLVRRSDQEFEISCTKGFNLISAEVLNLLADSIQLQSVPTALASENTYLMISPANTIVKREGASATAINDFTASTTYAVPSTAKSITVICVGGGGGGGAGRKGLTGTARYGGGGGSAGAITLGSFSLAALGNPANITVTVGSGGSGGTAQTTNGTNGNVGSAGGETSLSISGTKFIVAGGGSAGGGGTNAVGQGGALQDIGDFPSKAGSNSGLPTASAVTNSANKAAGSGGGGGGITTGDVTGSGAAGGDGYHRLCVGGTSGSSGGGSGGAGTAPSLDQYTGGGGGGGGSAFVTGAGAGGAGARGGGGGGGGAGTDSAANSGAGGAGGGGWVRIIVNY